MQYKIIKKFGPGSDGWSEYAAWAGMQACSDFYSIDHMQRTELFSPVTDEDWGNCTFTDDSRPLIGNLAYANKVCSRLESAEVVGVIKDPKTENGIIPDCHILMGYDILDGYDDISLLTNWGGLKEGIKNLKINSHGLVDDLEHAYQLEHMLRSEFLEDGHAQACNVWTVFKIVASTNPILP